MNPFRSLIYAFPMLLLMMANVAGQDTDNRLIAPVYPHADRVRDSIAAMRVPLLQMPEIYRNRTLPAMVDNSQNEYWPGIKDQYVFYTCQQYCGVNYVFGYEINRLRNQPGWYIEHNYPTHYTWNFMNEGYRYQGVNFLQSFEVIRQQGHMTLADYGNDTSTSVLGWISGYDKYYRGMFNHLKQVYAIEVNNAEGINTLRNFLYDHLDGSPTGGIACFTTSSGTLVSMSQLPAGTPEAGKDVVTYWQPNPNHGLTVVGYHDSIRFDINQDGQYTNNIDINHDGIVDARDWEIGAFKIANSYGFWWSNDGYTYALYSSFAQHYPVGGVWNNRVYVVEADTAYQPLLTLKVNLNYNSRDKIRILAGVSGDTLHQLPDHVIDFPIFNFQGADHAMMGVDSLPEAKNIEFGLDVTPLLNFVAPDKPARYFLMVEERDPEHIGQGMISQASFINYQNGSHQFQVAEEDVVILDNNLTCVSAVGTMTKPDVHIINNNLPPMMPDQPYQAQLEASGGRPPYDWSIPENYTMVPSQGTMPMITGTSIQVHQEYKSYVALPLPFSFPFYGKKYDSIYVNYYGFITFDPQYLPEPYVTDEMNMLETFASITPSFSQYYTYQANKNDGIWYQADASRLIIRWKVSVERYVTSSVNDFALILYPDGQFEFRYGTMENQGFLHTFYSGISRGDEQNFNLWTQWNANDISGMSYRFLPPVLPTGISITGDGLLEVMEADSSIIYDIPVQVADAGKITDIKLFTLSGGLEIVHQMVCNGSEQLEYGYDAGLRLQLTNLDSQPLQNLALQIRSVDSLVRITDSLFTFAMLEPGIPFSIESAFAFTLSQKLPDKYPVRLALHAQSGQRTWKKEMLFLVTGHNLVIAPPLVMDGDNGMLDPGEVADLVVTVENSGSLGINNLIMKLISHDTLISILSPSSVTVEEFGPNSKTNFNFQIAASRKSQGGHDALMQMQLCDSEGIILSRDFHLVLGKRPVALVNLATSRTSFEAMAEAFDSLYVGYDSLFALPFDYHHYQCVFLILGSSTQGSHTINIEEANSLSGYLSNGGKLYMEGYHTWYYLNKTPLHPWFKYTSAKIPVYYYPQATGIQQTFADAMTFGYEGPQELALFSFIPVEPAYATFTNTDSPPKNLEIVYDGEDYKTIGTFLDFGSLVENSDPSTRQNLMRQYLEFFKLNITGPFPLFHAANTNACLDRIVSFTDDSFENITSRSWEFEGGTPATSTESNPGVVYSQTGKFDVKLTVSDGTHTKSILKAGYITVGSCTGIDDNPTEPLFRIYPNPSSGIVTLDISDKINAPCSLTLFDFTGAKLMEVKDVVPAGNRTFLNLDDLRKGMYFLRLQAGTLISTQKVIIN